MVDHVKRLGDINQYTPDVSIGLQQGDTISNTIIEINESPDLDYTYCSRDEFFLLYAKFEVQLELTTRCNRSKDTFLNDATTPSGQRGRETVIDGFRRRRPLAFDLRPGTIRDLVRSVHPYVQYYKSFVHHHHRHHHHHQRHHRHHYRHIHRIILSLKLSTVLKWVLTRSSADADNRLDAFSGQSRSTNMVPFHMLHIVSYCAIVTLSLRHGFYDIRLQKNS